VATPVLGKFLVIMSGQSLGTCVSNLKSVALTVLDLLAFNSHDRPLRTHRQTDRQTDTHRTNALSISAIHFVHLAEMKIAVWLSGNIVGRINEVTLR